MLLYTETMRLKPLKLVILSLFSLINEAFFGEALLPILMLPSMKVHWYDKPGLASPIWVMMETGTVEKNELGIVVSVPLLPLGWVACRGLALSSDAPTLTLIWDSPSKCRGLTWTKEVPWLWKQLSFPSLLSSSSSLSFSLSLHPPHHWLPHRSDQISHSVMSDSLRPHDSQHARPPCPSPTPGVHSDSPPSSQWCHPAISSSVIPFSSCPQSLPASESFPMSQLFAWGGQSTGVQL